MNSIKLKLALLFTATIFTSSFSQENAPNWTQQHPINSEYYIGIGSSLKSEGIQSYRQIAKDRALQDLASEIKVNIASDFFVNVFENSDKLIEEVKSQIHSQTAANLEGYELVDSWEDGSVYWVYYRLAKTEYETRLNARKKLAKSRAYDLLQKSKASERENKIALAVATYINALSVIEEFFSEPLTMQSSRGSIHLQNEIYDGLNNLVSGITLKTKKGKITAKKGQALKEPLSVEAIYSKQDGSQLAVSNLPLKYSFIKGSGSIVPKIKTDLTGMALCPVTQISGEDKIQIVNVQLDLFASNESKLSPLSVNILKNITLPASRFILTVTGLTFYIEATETNLGKPLDVLQVEPQLKSRLAEEGFAFTDDLSLADILIELKANSRKGAEVYNLFSAFADLSISVTNLTSGEEVYKNTWPDIKGIQLDYEKAGHKALVNIGKKMEQITPELIKKIQK